MVFGNDDQMAGQTHAPFTKTVPGLHLQAPLTSWKFLVASQVKHVTLVPDRVHVKHRREAVQIVHFINAVR